MDTNIIHTGDCFDVLTELPDESVHAVVSDPPYGLAFMGRDWDDFEPKEYQEWCEKWARECKRVLKPGGHMLAFSGNRTHHRLFTGVEDAGFEIRDTLTWHYGSGFPKASDISKTIDKRGGAPPDLVDEISDALKEARKSRDMTKTEADELFCGGTTNYTWFEGRPDGKRLPPDETFTKIADEWPELSEYQECVKSANREVVGKSEHKSGIGNDVKENNTVGGTTAKHYDITAPATDAAKKWDGWKTGLKPATEFVVMARKPFDGATVDSVLEHGTGALNIDGCRVDTDGEELSYANKTGDSGKLETTKKWNGEENHAEGRYPANVVFDETAADALDREVGELETGDDPGTAAGATSDKYGEYNGDIQTPGYDGTGGPSRYFYTSKASRSERTENGCIENDHPTVKPLDLMEWLIKLVTAEEQTVLDPFCGSGTTLKAAKSLNRKFIGIERQAKWADVARVRVGLTPNDPSVVRSDANQSGMEAWMD